LSREIVRGGEYFVKSCSPAHCVIFAATCCALFLADSRHFVAVFSLLVRRFLRARRLSPVTTNSAFRSAASVVVLFLVHRSQGAATMEWTTPQHEEINLNCEISSYANAEL
jgi:hypothetical protein